MLISASARARSVTMDGGATFVRRNRRGRCVESRTRLAIGGMATVAASVAVVCAVAMTNSVALADAAGAPVGADPVVVPLRAPRRASPTRRARRRARRCRRRPRRSSPRRCRRPSPRTSPRLAIRPARGGRALGGDGGPARRRGAGIRFVGRRVRAGPSSGAGRRPRRRLDRRARGEARARSREHIGSDRAGSPNDAGAGLRTESQDFRASGHSVRTRHLGRRPVRRESNRAFPQADAIAMAGIPQPGLSQPPVSPSTGGFFVRADGAGAHSQR